MRRIALLASPILLIAACTQQQLPTQPLATPTPGSLAPGLVAVRLFDKDQTQVQSDFASASLDYVRVRKPLLGLGDRDDLSVGAMEHGVDGLSHMRFQQTHEGVKVWGSDVVVHASDTEFKSIAGSLTVGLDALNMNPALTLAQAMFAAKADYATGAKDAATPLQFSREFTELVVFPTETSGVHLAWHSSFYVEQQNGMNPGLWNYFVDAQTGALLFKFNAIDTLSEASGAGGNAKVPRTWTNFLDVEPSGSNYVMDTTKLRTTNMNHSQSGSGTIVSGASLSNYGDAAINDAHAYAKVTLSMLTDWFGYNSINNQGFKIISRVHYGNSYENAFWDGTQMTYGDGASTFYPLSGAVDVVAHEINHGFTSFHSNLTYSGMSGGMNEAFSDIAGTSAEWYDHSATANFLVGEDIFKASTGALRNMCRQSDDGASIDNASQYTPSLDVHYSSGVMAGAFCRAAKRIASGSSTGTATQDSVRKAAKAWYVANASYWTASATFTQGCQGVVDAATSLGYSATEIAAITTAWSEVGVSCGNAPPPTVTCDETLTTASGTIQSPNYPAAYGNNYNHTWCIVPAAGQPATLTFSAFDTESGYDFVTITNANGVQLSKTSGAVKPADATSTKIVVNFSTDASVTKTGFKATWTSSGVVNQAPTISLTAPANGSTVSGTVAVTASAADADGSVAKVTFTLPGGATVVDTTAPYSANWDTTTLANGSYSVSAVATDNMGAASAAASRTVTVSNGTTGTCVSGTFSATGLPLSIPDNNTTGITSNLAVTGAGTVASLTLSARITHTYQGDLVVKLVAPDGTIYTAFNRTGGSADNVVLTNVAVSAMNGKTAAGTWKLKVQDLAAADVGTLDSWSITLTGACPLTAATASNDAPLDFTPASFAPFDSAN